MFWRVKSLNPLRNLVNRSNKGNSGSENNVSFLFDLELWQWKKANKQEGNIEEYAEMSKKWQVDLWHAPIILLSISFFPGTTRFSSCILYLLCPRTRTRTFSKRLLIIFLGTFTNHGGMRLVNATVFFLSVDKIRVSSSDLSMLCCVHNWSEVPTLFWVVGETEWGHESFSITYNIISGHNK